MLAHVTSLDLDSPVPIRVYVFRNAESFEPYRHYYAYQPVATAGYFLERSSANYIAICAGAREDASSIVYHEYVHFVASANLRHLPLWFEEGLAELYQNFEVSGGRARIGLPVWRHLALLNSSPTLPLPELFAVDHDSPVYNDASLKGSFYAQSWALVHYLLIGSEARRAETARFIAVLHEGVPSSTAFAAAYSVDRRRAREGVPVVHRPPPLLLPRAAGHRRPHDRDHGPRDALPRRPVPARRPAHPAVPAAT